MPGRWKKGISTHAPAWGATLPAGKKGNSQQFLLTPPRGGRRRAGGLRRTSQFISTHAPAWGATGPVRAGGTVLVISTHAPAWGATGDALKAIEGGQVFLLTPPRGGRLCRTGHTSVRRLISTHAPAWGATWICSLPGLPTQISTHAPAWGATAIFHKHQAGV